MVRGVVARTDLSAVELPADCRWSPWNVDARALEREGFRVIDSRVASQEIDVEIVANDSDEESPWRLKMDGEEHHCSDIGSLITQIARHGLNEPANCPAVAEYIIHTEP